MTGLTEVLKSSYFLSLISSCLRSLFSSASLAILFLSKTISRGKAGAVVSTLFSFFPNWKG